MKKQKQGSPLDLIIEESEKAFIKVAVDSNQFSSSAARELAQSRVMRRLYHHILDPLYSFPSQSEFTIAIAIKALKMWSYQIDDSLILHYSIAVYEQLLRNLISNNKLNQALNSSGKNLLGYSTNSVDYEQILELINNKSELRKTFFSSYSTRSDDFVKVFLPNEDGYVDWKEDLSVDVAVNPFLGFELGFFQTGYDYKYISTQKGNLQKVTYSPNYDRESAVFTNKEIGVVTENIIWLA
jgi:hypothetical protein